MTALRLRAEVGSTVEILPAYSMDTRARTDYSDGLAGCPAVVTRDCGADLLVEILPRRTEEIWINRGRLLSLACEALS